MRPHLLSCSAFGPFAGTVELDFDLLGGTGLFLLHGETGAGKTTLLDALGYALYGSVPGERGKVGRLRSDHAGAGLRTQVRLEATLSGRRIRITRSPQQERRKTRGEGSTTEPAKVLLEERVSDCWQTLSTRAREADDEIRDLVGMSADQFFQVVLLPQGEFARFLRAGAKERGELLEKLFGTARFRSVEIWLADRRVRTARVAEQAEAQVELVGARVRQAAGFADLAPDDPVTLVWAQELATRAAAELAVARTALARGELAVGQARAAHEATAALAAAQQRLTALLQTQAELTVRRPQVQALTGEVERADRAAEVAGLLVEQERRGLALHEAAGAVETARQGVEVLGPDALGPDALGPDALGPDALGHDTRGFSECGSGAAQLQEAIAACRESLGRLEALRAVELRRDRARGRQVAAQQQLADLDGELAEIERSLALMPARREQMGERVDAGRAGAVRLPALRAETIDLERALADAATHERLTAERGSLREQLLLAREQAVALRDKAADVREARLDDVRFELATMLVTGDPCPVCGALEHPDPSEVHGSRVTRDDEDAARATADDAARTVTELGERLAAVEAERAAVAARADRRSPAQATLLALQAEIAALETLVARLPEHEQELAGLEVEREAGGLRRTTLIGARQQARTRHDEAAAESAALAVELERGLAGAVSVDAAVLAQAGRAAALEQLLEAGQQLDRCRSESADAQERAQSACLAAGFGGTDAAGAAVRAGEWRSQARRTLQDEADQAAACRTALADPALAVSLEPAAPVAEHAQALATAEATLRRGVELATTTGVRSAGLDALLPALAEALAALTPAQEQAGAVRSLADLCNGSGANQLRMSLSSFVLAARLEEVAEAASVRLLRMTQGRYRLVHSDGAARGGARSGLGLLARDSWTGQDRDTATLSGGESFQASLALALGLSDVVMAEAGGARIETLFVDEGFGSLDEDTLEEVMDVLDGLREGGRLVGLVSHVSEMRARIPAQVHVRKTRSGSDLVLLGCDG